MTTELAVHLVNEELAGPSVLAEIDTLISNLAAAEEGLESGYAKLGFLLTEVSEHSYWRGRYASFNEYIAAIGQKFHRGRTSLYSYFGTVRDLKDHVPAEQLAQIGIGKAQELARALKSSGVGPSAEIIKEAVKSTVSVKDVRKLLYDSKQLGESETGEWLDLDMSGFVTADQKLLILSALKSADRTDPVIQPTVKASARNIERMTRFSMEYLNSHGEEE